MTTGGVTRGVIFDLDGTLADTLEDIADAAKFALAERGLQQHPVEAYKRFIGGGVRTLLELAMPLDVHHMLDDALAAFRKRYSEHLLDKTRPYPGIGDLLDRLSDDGVKLAVLSNKPDAPTQKIVDGLFARWSFVHVAGQKPDVPKKPDPLAATAICQMMELSPADCFFVGDSEVDVKTGVAASMVSIGVDWGFREARTLHGQGARAVLSHPMELLPLLSE